MRPANRNAQLKYFVVWLTVSICTWIGLNQWNSRCEEKFVSAYLGRESEMNNLLSQPNPLTAEKSTFTPHITSRGDALFLGEILQGEKESFFCIQCAFTSNEKDNQFCNDIATHHLANKVTGIWFILFLVLIPIGVTYLWYNRDLQPDQIPKAIEV